MIRFTPNKHLEEHACSWLCLVVSYFCNAHSERGKLYSPVMFITLISSLFIFLFVFGNPFRTNLIQNVTISSEHSKKFNAEDMQARIDGKNCIVTGANSGIGYATAQGLASRFFFLSFICYLILNQFHLAHL